MKRSEKRDEGFCTYELVVVKKGTDYEVKCTNGGLTDYEILGILESKKQEILKLMEPTTNIIMDPEQAQKRVPETIEIKKNVAPKDDSCKRFCVGDHVIIDDKITGKIICIGRNNAIVKYDYCVNGRIYDVYDVKFLDFYLP